MCCSSVVIKEDPEEDQGRHVDSYVWCLCTPPLNTDSFPVSSCWYFYCKFEEGRLEREEEVEAKGMMGRKGRRKRLAKTARYSRAFQCFNGAVRFLAFFSILSFRLTY